MKKSSILIILILLTPLACISQRYLNMSKIDVLKKLKKHNPDSKKNSINYSKTDSSIIMTVNGPEMQPFIFTFLFNSSGKCGEEKTTANCDSCFKKRLNAVLNQKNYRWQKINENQYISKYSKKIMIELPAENNILSFSILKTTMTKQLYRFLLSKN